MHADRGRGHDEAHHRIRGQRGEHRETIARDAQQLARRTTAAAIRLRRRWRRRKAHQHRCGAGEQHGEREERAGVFRPPSPKPRLLPEQRAEDRGSQRTEHHGGDGLAGRLGAGVLRHQLRGGEAILLHHRGMDAEQRRRKTEPDEAALRDAERAGERRHATEQGARDQHLSPPMALHQERRGDRGGREPDDRERPWQRGQRRRWREASPDDTAERDQHDGAAGGERLREGQCPDMAHRGTSQGCAL